MGRTYGVLALGWALILFGSRKNSKPACPGGLGRGKMLAAHLPLRAGQGGTGENVADRGRKPQANPPALHRTLCGARVAQTKRVSAGHPQPPAPLVPRFTRGVRLSPKGDCGVHTLTPRSSGPWGWAAFILLKCYPISSNEFILEFNFIFQNSIATFNCFCRSNIIILACKHDFVIPQLFYLFKK